MINVYKKILTLAIPLFIAVGGLVAIPQVAYASPADEVGKGIKASGSAGDCDGHECTLSDSIKTITNVLLFIIGTVAVIMIILGGIRYTTSNGDSSQVTAAKNTILYSVIGLVVALLAFAIINFIIGQFAK